MDTCVFELFCEILRNHLHFSVILRLFRDHLRFCVIRWVFASSQEFLRDHLLVCIILWDFARSFAPWHYFKSFCETFCGILPILMRSVITCRRWLWTPLRHTAASLLRCFSRAFPTCDARKVYAPKNIIPLF